MEKNQKNKENLLFFSFIGISIASILLIVTFLLGKYSINAAIYYVALFLIGPPLAIGFITSKVFLYSIGLFIYFIVLSIILCSSSKINKKTILVIIFLLHFFSIFLVKYIAESQFKFLDKINWGQILKEWK